MFCDDLLPHGLTYSGHPICCAAALANIEVIENDNLVAHAAEMGRHLAARLTTLRENFPIIQRAENLGLFAAIELGEIDVAAIDPAFGSVGELVMAMAEQRGVLLRGADNRVYLAPPLVVSAAEIDVALDCIDQILRTITATAG